MLSGGHHVTRLQRTKWEGLQSAASSDAHYPTTYYPTKPTLNNLVFSVVSNGILYVTGPLTF